MPNLWPRINFIKIALSYYYTPLPACRQAGVPRSSRCCIGGEVGLRGVFAVRRTANKNCNCLNATRPTAPFRQLQFLGRFSIPPHSGAIVCRLSVGGLKSTTFLSRHQHRSAGSDSSANQSSWVWVAEYQSGAYAPAFQTAPEHPFWQKTTA